MLILDLSLIMPFAFDSFDIWCGRTSTCSLDYAGFVLTRNKQSGIWAKVYKEINGHGKHPLKNATFSVSVAVYFTTTRPKSISPVSLSIRLNHLPPQPTINLATVCLVCANIQPSPAVLHRGASGTLSLEFGLS